MNRTVRLATVLLAVSSCSEPEGAVYFPDFHKGAQLEYDMEYTRPFGGVATGTMVIRTEGDTTIGDKRYVRTVTVISGIPGLGQFVTYSRRAKDGMYQIDTTAVTATEVLVIPFPIGVGAAWSATLGGTRTSSKVEALERLALVHRTYDDCLKVSANQTGPDGASQTTLWYARGVGLVKMVAQSRGVTMQFTLAVSSR